MDKRIIYGVGGVALVGIAYYLYSKSKSGTKSTTDATAPIMSEELGNMPNPNGVVVPVVGSGSGSYSPNPNAIGDNKFTSSPSTSSSSSTSSVVAVRPSTPSGAGEVVPSTNDVDLFVDPPSTTPKVSPYSPYVVGSNIYYYMDETLFTNDVNAILSNNAIPPSQKTTAINGLRQLAIDSIVSNVAIYGNVLQSAKKTGALNSVNSISDNAIAQVQTQLNALISTPIRTTPPTTTKDTTPIVTRGFDGGFSYADGRRFRSRRNSLRGF